MPVLRTKPLKKMLALMTAAALLVTGGCASRGVPEAAPAPQKPLRLVAVLPTANAPSGSGSGFSTNRHSTIFVPESRNRGSSAGSVAGAIGATLIVGAIAYGLNERKRTEAEALNDALSHVNFEPTEYLDAQLSSELERRGIRLVRILDPRVAIDARTEKFAGLPEGVDAILDVKVLESGYYSSLRAGGYSPMLHLNASLRVPEPDADELDSFSYYADWRNGGKDKRWVTTPRNLTFESIEKLKGGATAARNGLEEVVKQFAVMISQDVERLAKGQSRID